jgi:DNA-directed RNA polymerase subunit RPC12/RpoP
MIDIEYLETAGCLRCGHTFMWTLEAKVRGTCAQCESGELVQVGNWKIELTAAAEREKLRRALRQGLVYTKDPGERRSVYNEVLEARGRGDLDDRCIVCGRELTDPESIARMIGSTCWTRWEARLQGQ